MKSSVLLQPADWLEKIEAEGEEVPIPLPPCIASMPPLVLGRATFLGGPTNGGKTALALQCWRTALEASIPSAYITLEMSPSDLYRRFVRQFDSDQECQDWIIENEAIVSEVSLDDKEIENVILDGEFGLVVIDHVHELDYADRRELERMVTRIAKLAPRTNTALLILAQLKRPSFEQDAPSKGDFRETGRIEQVASVLWQLWQPDELDDEIQLYCTKSRFTAKPGPIDLRINKETVTFEEIYRSDMLFRS